MAENVFDGVPPDQPIQGPKTYKVVSPKPGQPLDCTLLDSRILGLLTHFDYSPSHPRGKSWFCYWEDGTCTRCVVPLPKIWQGYIGAFCHTLGHRIVLCLGKESAIRLADYAAKHGGLHLLKTRVRKPETGNKAALMFEKSEHLGKFVDPGYFDISPSVALALSVARLPDYRYTSQELADSEVPNG